MQKDYLGKSLLIITLATVGATALYAWTGATSNPPTENAYAPINIGGFKQIKTGDICTTFSGVEKCLSTVTGLVGPQGPKGDQGPAGGADGIGYGGTATGAVNMNFNNIGNIGTADIGVANIINANLSAFKLSTNPGLGKVLVSDNNGYGYWQTLNLPSTGVTSLTAGTGITLSPASGTGDVTVSASTPTNTSTGLYVCMQYSCYSGCQLPDWNMSVKSSVPSGFTLIDTGKNGSTFGSYCYKI